MQTVEDVKKEAVKEYVEAVVAELEKEYDLAEKEMARCMRENILQYDEANGYARGVDTAIEIVRGKE
jgi:molybdopterin converting factor small subunit